MQVYELIRKLAKYRPDTEVEGYEVFGNRPFSINFVVRSGSGRKNDQPVRLWISEIEEK